MQQEILNFFQKIEGIYNSKLPFVIYRKPNEKEVFVVFQNTVDLFELSTDKENGFVFAPFSKNQPKIIFPIEECEQFSINIQDFEELNISTKNATTIQISNLEETKLQHIALVQKTIDYIQNNEAEKIVISRMEMLKHTNFEVLNSYKKMLKNYENAMVYLWFHPSVGCWMGASPERLLNCNLHKFKTMALAGTQAFKGEMDVLWNEKEIKEQKFVTDYILETIQSTISNITFTKPYTVKAGNLLHLCTDIYGELTVENSLKNLIDSLHPTPAICGVPKLHATNFIAENEGYNRAFYTGYLGEQNINNETNLYVNLRCMQINQDHISLYIGGGITVASMAEKEWDETVFKAEVMKKIL